MTITLEEYKRRVIVRETDPLYLSPRKKRRSDLGEMMHKQSKG